jgi:hypothetical protein
MMANAAHSTTSDSAFDCGCHSPENEPKSVDRRRPLRIMHLFYATALVAAGASAFGSTGLFASGCGLVVWAGAFFLWPGRLTIRDVGILLSIIALIVMSFVLG